MPLLGLEFIQDDGINQNWQERSCPWALYFYFLSERQSSPHQAIGLVW